MSSINYKNRSAIGAVGQESSATEAPSWANEGAHAQYQVKTTAESAGAGAAPTFGVGSQGLLFGELSQTREGTTTTPPQPTPDHTPAGPVIPQGSSTEIVVEQVFGYASQDLHRALSVSRSSIPAQNEGLADTEGDEPTPPNGQDLGLGRNLNRVCVSGAVWNELAAAFPILTESGIEADAARRLVAYLAFGAWINPNSERLVIGNQTLADIAGASLRADGRWEKGFAWESGREFLGWARNWLPNLRTTNWNSANAHAREVTATGFSDSLTETLRVERLTAPLLRSNLVNVLTGQSQGERKENARRASVRRGIEQRCEANASNRDADHLTTRVLAVVNGASPTLLRSVLTPDALANAYASLAPLGDAAQRVAAAALDTIADSPKQPFKTVRNSTRIFPDGAGLVGLDADIRAPLLCELRKVDWSKAQFAVNAFLYDIEPVAEALRCGFDWQRLTAWLGLPHTADSEALVKRATYALNYCAGDAEVIANLTGVRAWRWTENVTAADTATGIDHATAKRFLDEPLIRATREAMQAAREKVKRDGGARDAFGDWISLAAVADSLKGSPYKKAENSVLAQVAQSWELELQRPLIEMLESEAAKTRPNVSLGVWLWDGAYLHVRQHADATLGAIKRACDRHAAALGIPTTLAVG